MTRPLDSLGRITIPAEVRKGLFLDAGDLLSLWVDENSITLTPVRTTCIFCGGEQKLTKFMGKQVCKACMEKLA